MKDAKGHGSEKRGGAAHQVGVREATDKIYGSAMPLDRTEVFIKQEPDGFRWYTQDGKGERGFSDAMAAGAHAAGTLKKAIGAKVVNDADLIRYHQGKANFYSQQMTRSGRNSDKRNFEKHDRAVRSLMSKK